MVREDVRSAADSDAELLAAVIAAGALQEIRWNLFILDSCNPGWSIEIVGHIEGTELARQWVPFVLRVAKNGQLAAS